MSARSSISRNIILSSSTDTLVSNKLTSRFPVAYKSTSDKIGLSSVAINYSWFNLTAQFNNLQVRYFWVNNAEYAVDFPPGFYSVDSLSQYIQFKMKQNGHYLVNDSGIDVFYLELVVNPVYYTVTLIVKPVPSVLPVDWTNPGGFTLPETTRVPLLKTITNEWGRLIGFGPNEYFPCNCAIAVETRVNSTLTPRISPIISVNVLCSFVNDDTFSTRYSSVIGSFIPDKAFGSPLNIVPPVILMYPVTQSLYKDISVSFVDQDFNPLQLNDSEGIQIKLILTTEI